MNTNTEDTKRKRTIFDIIANNFNTILVLMAIICLVIALIIVFKGGDILQDLMDYGYFAHERESSLEIRLYSIAGVFGFSSVYYFLLLCILNPPDDYDSGIGIGSVLSWLGGFILFSGAMDSLRGKK